MDPKSSRCQLSGAKKRDLATTRDDEPQQECLQQSPRSTLCASPDDTLATDGLVAMDQHEQPGSEGANATNESSSYVSHGRGGLGAQGRREKERGGKEEGEIQIGFLNCRGWWSREVDVNMVLRELRLDVFGLAETFLQRNEVPSVAGYSWFGCNRERGRKAGGGVGLLVRNGLKARVLKEHEAMMWVELRLETGEKLAIGVVYMNPEGVRVQESQEYFDVIQADVLQWYQKGYRVVVMGDFNAHIGLGEEVTPNRNGRRLLNMTFAANMAIVNELSICEGRWTWESGSKQSVVDYILVPHNLKDNIVKMVVEAGHRI